MKYLTILNILVVFIIIPIDFSYSKEKGKEFKFHYPELMVVPQASHRIKLEAKEEKKNKLYHHIPIQVSALTTFIGGLLQFSNVDDTKDDSKDSAKLGVFIGGGWLLTTFLLSQFYKPYQTAFKSLNEMKSKTEKDKLTRERMAEESLKKAAKLGTRLKYLSFFSNLPTAIYMLAEAKKDTISIPVNAAAVVASIAPLIFTYSWNQIYKEQMNYKKKIYAPLVSNTILYHSGLKKYLPGITLSWNL